MTPAWARAQPRSLHISLLWACKRQPHKNYCSNPDPHCDEYIENRQTRDLQVVLIYYQMSSFATEKPAKKGVLMKTCFCLTTKKALMLFVFVHFAQTCFISLHNRCSNNIVQREKWLKGRPTETTR